MKTKASCLFYVLGKLKPKHIKPKEKKKKSYFIV